MRLLISILVSFPVFVFAQMPVDSATKKITYSEVVELPAFTKDQLYSRARSWYAKTYRSANSVLQMDDREAGKIIGKGYYVVYWQMNGERKVWHLVEIGVKDGRYRYLITDFVLEFSDAYKDMPFETINPKKFWGIDNFYNKAHDRCLLMIKDLKAYMGEAKTDDDW